MKNLVICFVFAFILYCLPVPSLSKTVTLFSVNAACPMIALPPPVDDLSPYSDYLKKQSLVNLKWIRLAEKRIVCKIKGMVFKDDSPYEFNGLIDLKGNVLEMNTFESAIERSASVSEFSNALKSVRFPAWEYGFGHFKTKSVLIKIINRSEVQVRI